jgi:hypothetical protein
VTHDHRTMAHRVQCAAITRGCTSALTWEDHSTDVDERFLRRNGWRLDHGQWICGDHDATPADPMTERKDPPRLPREDPYAEITQVGRWLWQIEIHDGLMVLTPPTHKLGRRRAERAAHRKLARYLRGRQREREAIRIDAREATR